MNIDKNFLLKEYKINRKSITQIANLCKCHPSTIYDYLKKYNIDTNQFFIDKDILEDYYVNKKLSTYQIAKKYDVDPSTINSFRKKYNIPINSLNISKEKLIEEYSINKRPINELLEIFGCSKTTLYKKIKEYEIPNNDLKITKEWLIEEYLLKGKTEEEIEKEYCISQSTISKYRNLYNIPNFERILIDKNTLENYYINEKLSSKEISKIIKCSHHTINFYLRKYNIPINYNTESNLQKEIENFLFEEKIQYYSNFILKNKELDIYLPDYNIAIEFNGLIWHSYNPYCKYFNTKKYENTNAHLLKTILCEENGIQLLHIFEDEWINKKDIWKSIILSKCGIFKERIYARKCIVKEVSNFEAKLFLNQNHLQDAINGKHYGLYYNYELVQIMSYGKSRFELNKNELYRFATKLNTQVVGGFGKLFKYINKSMVTFADRRYSNGKVYKNFGEFINVVKPGYFWVKGLIKINRHHTMKHKLPKLLGENFDPNLTEKENMFRNGYRILYDCGNLKYELKN